MHSPVSVWTRTPFYLTTLFLPVTAQESSDGRAWYQFFTIVWIFVGLSWLAIIITDVGDFYTKTVTNKTNEIAEKVMLKIPNARPVNQYSVIKTVGSLHIGSLHNTLGLKISVGIVTETWLFFKKDKWIPWFLYVISDMNKGKFYGMCYIFMRYSFISNFRFLWFSATVSFLN